MGERHSISLWTDREDPSRHNLISTGMHSKVCVRLCVCWGEGGQTSDVLYNYEVSCSLLSLCVSLCVCFSMQASHLCSQHELSWNHHNENKIYRTMAGYLLYTGSCYMKRWTNSKQTTSLHFYSYHFVSDAFTSLSAVSIKFPPTTLSDWLHINSNRLSTLNNLK